MKKSLPIVVSIVVMVCGCGKTLPPPMAPHADLYTNSYENELKLQLHIAANAYSLAEAKDATRHLDEALTTGPSAEKKSAAELQKDIEPFALETLTNYMVTNFWAQKASGSFSIPK